MPDFKLDSVFTPTADQPQAIAAHGRGGARRRALPDAARRHRHGQDDDDGRRDRGGAAADARDRAQQDARRAAVQRVPHVLPGQRGRVLRLLLRLLPARGVRPEPRPLHREGLGDQPGGRPPAPRRDGGGVRAPRRDRGRVGVLHLRPRLAGDLRDEHADPQARRGDRPRRAAAQARLDPVHAQRHGALARHLPGARRDARGLPRLRRDGLPRDACSATRSSACSTSTRSPASCSQTTSSTSRSGRRRTTTSRRGRSSPRSRRSARSSNERCAELESEGKQLESHRLRQRTQYDMEMLREVGLLLGHRELLAHPRRPPPRRRGRTA